MIRVERDWVLVGSVWPLEMPNISTSVRQLEEVHATAAALRLLSDSSAEAPGRLSYLESWGNSIHKQPWLEWGKIPMCQQEFHNYPCIQDPPYIHAYLPTYRQTDRQQADRQIDRPTDGRTDRQTDGQTARQPHSQPGRKAGRQTGDMHDMHDMRDMHEILTY